MKARYTDGTPVQEGDRVRYHQTPGGLLPPATDVHGDIVWHEGIAAKYPYLPERREALRARWFIDPDELHLLAADGTYYHMAPHIIERLVE